MWSLVSVRWICGENFDICCFRTAAFTMKRNWSFLFYNCDYRREALGARAASSGSASLIAHISSSLYHVKTWRHPRNRKYVIYRFAVRGGQSYKKLCDIWTCGFWDMRADRQTDRHADRNDYLVYATYKVLSVNIVQTYIKPSKHRWLRIKIKIEKEVLRWRVDAVVSEMLQRRDSREFREVGPASENARCPSLVRVGKTTWKSVGGRTLSLSTRWWGSNLNNITDVARTALNSGEVHQQTLLVLK